MTSYEQALEELPNVHDPAARAIVLALLAIAEAMTCTVPQ